MHKDINLFNKGGINVLKQLKKRTSGFTIIEVMIVLAIAGLILLIVFLAVPALQRNARNTQRRNDVARLLAAVQEYVNNNNGNLPTTSSAIPATALSNFGSASQFNTTVSLGLYNINNVAWSYSTVATATTDPANINR
ncbi:type II secretion system protein [Candidatus Saccharibacteria bacterium]|nr:type II secretion system protein [Candidatus Saccharibacteria bacterium]